ncbi:protein of unknown function DUF1552 [Chthoniobacter flavus Ellin428]|uniref:DUF1552 domain-containing protein n=2 Tax=Chthoniobacter flavus TaxID=191863 RepID=B4D2Z0_9BACT|nr:DUF1552 domain-containing protein [Chthoniobacter flavus]EDY19101.1 protein of unknown function DUF1552 [Chthoniobacter flavus Ellin428]
MGLIADNFFPKETGLDWTPSPYLEIIQQHRKDFTLFSGTSHPAVDGGHAAELAFLTAAAHPGAGGFKNSISLDQFAAEQIGSRTRIPSLTILVGSENRHSLSFTRSGVMIPAEKSAAAIYRRMFVQGTPQEVEARVNDLREGRSVLDFVNDSAKRMQRDLGPRDRERLDQYFTSVRDLEGQLVEAEAWEHRPKPKVSMAEPKDITENDLLVQRLQQMFGVLRLALETDSTRLITLFINPFSMVPKIDGVTHETHSITHHGNRPETLQELGLIEAAHFRVLDELLTGLKAAKEDNETLLDRTQVLFGSCMGNANAHDNHNLPVLIAGGGYKHGQHLGFDHKQNYPLPNLFVSMLQRMGLETDKFASSTGTMRGLDVA